MKKALSFAVALGLVAGMASSAVASDMLDFHGEARVRAIRTDFGGTDNKMQGYTQRYRFVVNANVTDTVSVNTRFSLIDSYLGDGAAASGEQMDSTGTSLDTPVVDYAFIQVKDLAGGTWSAGRMPASWTKFLSWGGHADRIKAMYPAGGGQLGFFIEKTEENWDGSGADGDTDKYSALYVGNAGDIKFKVIGISVQASTPDGLGGFDTNNGTMFDANVVAPAGPVSVEAEFAYKGGDLFESANSAAQMGLMVNASMDVGNGIKAMGLLGYGSDDFKADDDYNPSNLIGNSVTAITVFGVDQFTTATDSDFAYIVAVGAGMAIDDASSVSAGVGYYMVSDLADAKITELDVNYTRNLAKNTDLMAKFAFAQLDGVTPTDDDVMAIGVELSTKW